MRGGGRGPPRHDRSRGCGRAPRARGTTLSEALPAFRYHPDPVRTGSIEESLATCWACGRARGYIYTGPLYREGADEVVVCPWCIADGSAAARFELELTDVGWGVPAGVPEPVLDELARCTPGFAAWQSDHWLYHCADACAYLGGVGFDELRRLPEALQALLDGLAEAGFDAEASQELVESLSSDESPTAYLFRCLACGTHLAYSDTA